MTISTARFLTVLLGGVLAALPVSARAGYSLVWYDEFDGTSLDTASWSIDTGNGCPDLCGWGNNELQTYRTQNVAVRDGNLVLTARANDGVYPFTSGKVTTKNKQSFLYGRFEARAKLPRGGGMWPAFWMMPQDDAYGGWAASGELDIMESSNAMDYINGTIHYGGTWPQNTYSGGTYSPAGSDFSDGFHVYAVEWEPDQIRWYVDGQLYYTRTSSQWYSNNAPGNARAPFDQPFYVILNAAVGGNYTGCTTAACITASFPQEYVIDYVRVYADIPNALPTIAITSPTSGQTVPGGDVVIEVDASDSDGSIDRVEFYDGYTLLGQDTTAPYEFTWSNVDPGCYQVRARVVDDLGGTAEAVTDLTVGIGCGQAPYGGIVPVVNLGRIEAEDFDEGGAGVAYVDSDASNNGGQYRPAEEVDIEATTDAGGGYNVGWLAPGEWMEYTVAFLEAGEYTLQARVASQTTGGTFRLEVDGNDVTGEVVVPSTGGWQSWVDVEFTTSRVESGIHVMRFVPTGGEFNVNWFESVSVATSAPGAPAMRAIERLDSYPNPFNPRTTVHFELGRASTVTLQVYDASGRAVRTLLDGDVLTAGDHDRVWDGRDDSGRSVAGGVYYARLRVEGGESETVRMVLLK